MFLSARLPRAETRYHLGISLMEQGRHAEALVELELSRDHVNLNRVALMRTAEIHERTGAAEEALEVWRELCRLDSRNIGYILEFARLAGDLEEWSAALESLRWGILIHPEDPRTLSGLVSLHLARGDPGSAARRLRQLERVTGSTPEVRRFRERLGSRPGS